jgi:signal transduction histidine kinase
MIVNAAHAIEEKQKSTDDKSKGLIKISTYSEDNFVKIAISDSGVGISEETMFKLFDPFFTTKEVGKGTGQGLSIAYDIIVNKHFGNIDVKSKPGEGATFIITLPMK